MDNFLKKNLIVSQDSSSIQEIRVSAMDYFSKQNRIDFQNSSHEYRITKKI